MADPEAHRKAQQCLNRHLSNPPVRPLMKDFSLETTLLKFEKIKVDLVERSMKALDPDASLTPADKVLLFLPYLPENLETLIINRAESEPLILEDYERLKKVLHTHCGDKHKAYNTCRNFKWLSQVSSVSDYTSQFESYVAQLTYTIDDRSQACLYIAGLKPELEQIVRSKLGNINSYTLERAKEEAHIVEATSPTFANTRPAYSSVAARTPVRPIAPTSSNSRPNPGRRQASLQPNGKLEGMTNDQVSSLPESQRVTKRSYRLPYQLADTNWYPNENLFGKLSDDTSKYSGKLKLFLQHNHVCLECRRDKCIPECSHFKRSRTN